MKKLLSILLVLCLLSGLTAFASGEASGSASGDASAAADTGPRAVFVFGDGGEDTENEQTDGFELTWFENGGRDSAGIHGFHLFSDRSDTALYYSEPTQETGNVFTIGGDGDNVDVVGDSQAIRWMEGVGVRSYDSAVSLLDGDGAASCPPVISAKGWTNLYLKNLYIRADGAARSAFYSDVSGGSTVPGPGSGGKQGSESPVVVVANSLLETTGGAGISGEIAVGASGGRARGIQPQGKSITYLYNSAIVSRTWGAWSTDSARQSLDLVAWRSLGLSQGGYGAYADTSCRLFLYGSTLVGSSDGVVASNNGEIYATDSDDATNSTALRAVMGRSSAPRDLCWTDFPAAGDTFRSVIKGGQAAVQFHMPDLGHSGARNQTQGTLYMKGGALVTDESLIAGGLEGIAAYNRHYAGACIVTKSAQTSALLQGTEMDSWKGVLIHCVINSDSNVNSIADGDATIGSTITLQDMDVSGDVIHDDYQRELYLNLDRTTLSGAIHSNTCRDWNDLCMAEFGGNYILDPDGYDTWWGVTVTLSNGAVWDVTDVSVVTDLVVGDGCRVNGAITENPDGTLTVSPLSSGEASAS